MQPAPALEPNAKPRYKAFVSYAWSADRALAPVLRAVLESFDAPLFGIPRSKVFCDQTDLEAAPQLWPKIQRAIHDSEHFILLASPAAAKSRWVARELEEWLGSHHNLDGVRIALTAGAAPWDPETNDFHWETTTAIPPVLKGRFAEEPKLVDLTALDVAPLRHDNLELRIQLAEFAPLFGKTKRQLTDVLLREGQRRLRWAINAAVALALLAVAAGAAAYLAVRSQRETEQQRQVAETRRQEADQQRSAAEAAGELALARQLAAQAELLYVSQPEKIELASLLAVEAVRRARTPETDRALRETSSRLTRTTASAFAGHGIRRIAVSPDGRWFAAGGEDKTTRIFNLPTGKQVMVIPHKDWVWALAFSPDGKTFVSTSADGTAIVATLPGWKTRLTLHERKGIRTVAFSSDGKYLAVGGWSHDATVYELPGGAQVSRWEHPESVFSLAFHPSSAILATGTADHKARLYEVGGNRIGFPMETGEKIMDIRFSPDGNSLGMAVADGFVQVFDTATRREKWRYTGGVVASRLSFSPNGNQVAIASFDGIARVLNADKLGSEVSRLVHRAEVHNAAFSPDNLWVATASQDKTVRVFDASSGREVRRFGMAKAVQDVAWHPSGNRLIAADDSGAVQLLDFSPALEHAWRPPFPPAPPAVSPDGRWLLRPDSIGGLHANAVESGAPIAALDATETTLLASFSPDGKLLGRVRADATIELVTVPEGRLIERWQSPGASAVVALTSGGENAVIHGTFNGVRLTKRIGKRRQTIEIAYDCKVVNQAAFSTDGNRLAIACSDGTVRTLDALDGHELWRAKFSQSASAVAFSPDGSLIAAGSYDGTARLLNAKTGVEQRQLPFPSAARAVALSPANWLAVATEDRRIYIYDAMGQHAWTYVDAAGDYPSLAFRGNDELVSASSTIDTTWLQRFILPASGLITNACASLSRDLTADEFRTYLPGRAWRATCAPPH